MVPVGISLGVSPSPLDSSAVDDGCGPDAVDEGSTVVTDGEGSELCCTA